MRRATRVGLVSAGLLAFALAVPAAAEVVRGTPKGDSLTGGKRGDRLMAHAGDDRLGGRRGSDFLKAGTGDDLLIGGKGFDDLRGGAGDDVLRTRDGEPDFLDCGPGFDTATVDAIEDGVLDCEEVIEP